MGLRPAKSMDSLSSVPCASKEEAQLGRNKSHKQQALCRDSFDGPASLDPSFLELDEGPGEAKDPPGGGESEGEGTARSEPTTPKASRGSLAGASPQGRSPKAARNRAEKCVGVHISGPFSVMVPFHITSNLTLSRLTRGQECPALVHGCQEKEPTDSSVGKEEKDREEKAEGHQDATEEEEEEEEATGAETNTDGLNDAEVNRMSMEVQDSFSFLDGQDAWLGDSLQEDPPLQSFPAPPAFMGAGLDDRPSAEDDLGSGFMSEMLGSEVQLAMFSSLPPLDYLSIEECMDEHLGDEEEYYLATDCIHGEPPPKESDSGEVYLSAFDDLSPLAHEPGDLQPPDEVRESGVNPPQRTLEDQPFSLLVGPSLEGDTRCGLLCEDKREPPLGSPPPQGPGRTDFHPDPEFQANLGSESGESETQQEGEAKATTETAAGLGSPVTPSEVGATSGPDGEGVLPRTVALGSAEPDGGAVQEKTLQRSLEVDRGDQVAPSTSPEDEWRWPLETHALFQDGPPPCPPRVAAVEVDSWTPSGASGKPAEVELPCQVVQQPHSGEAGFPPETARAPSPTEAPSSFGAHPPSSPGRFPENASSRRSPGGLPAESLDPTGDPLPEWAPLQPSFISSKSFPEIHLQKPQPLPRGEPPAGFTPELSDGSIPMKLTSSTVRVQQARSFPVVPPKPQFAKIPPDLQPRAPAKKAAGPGPVSSVFGDGTKEGLGEGSLPRPLRPASLDMSCGQAERDQNTGAFSASTSFLDNSRDESGAHQKERNSMPGSLEKYGRRSKGREHCAPKSLPSPLDETGLWPEKGRTDGEDPGPRRCPAFEKQEGSQPKNGDGNGAAPEKLRWGSSRCHKGSISFDEAVSLAKERHRGQAPVRRMQTYCYGDGDGPRGPLQAVQPGPQAKPDLKPTGEGPRRPGSCSCLGATAPLEAPAPLQALPNVFGREGALPPSQEGLPPPQGGQPWRRMSLAKIGRRASVSEESVRHGAGVEVTGFLKQAFDWAKLGQFPEVP